MKDIGLKIKLYLASLMVVMSGCDSFVEPAYVPEFPWTTVDQLEMAAILPYTAFTGGGWSEPQGVYAFYECLATDIGSPIMQAVGNNPWNEFLNRMHREVPLEAGSMGWVKGAYEQLYACIAGANEPLAFLETEDLGSLFPEDTGDKISTVVPRIKAELYFWRGFSYYWAALWFCPPYVPGGTNADQILPLKVTNENPQDTPIGTTQEIWDQVIKDLTTAKSLMDKEYHVSGRVDYYTICGALARAYFYMGNYEAAQKECDEIISSGKYSLPKNVMEAWTMPVGGTEPSEVIWMFNTSATGQLNYTYTCLSKSDAWGNGGGRGEHFSQCSWAFIKLSNAMLKKINWVDDNMNPTKEALADSRFNNTWLYLKGYKGHDEVPELTEAEWRDTYESVWDQETIPHVYPDKFYRGENPLQTNQPRMRIPEFYLMRAATRFKLGDKNGAAADINVIRDRAGLSSISGADITENDIDREWVIELGGEGLYLSYLIGMQKPILSGDRVGVAAVNPPYEKWYFMIPIDEVRINAGYNGIADPNQK